MALNNAAWFILRPGRSRGARPSRQFHNRRVHPIPINALGRNGDALFCWHIGAGLVWNTQILCQLIRHFRHQTLATYQQIRRCRWSLCRSSHRWSPNRNPGSSKSMWSIRSCPPMAPSVKFTSSPVTNGICIEAFTAMVRPTCLDQWSLHWVHRWLRQSWHQCRGLLQIE